MRKRISVEGNVLVWRCGPDVYVVVCRAHCEVPVPVPSLAPVVGIHIAEAEVGNRIALYGCVQVQKLCGPKAHDALFVLRLWVTVHAFVVVVAAEVEGLHAVRIVVGCVVPYAVAPGSPLGGLPLLNGDPDHRQAVALVCRRSIALGRPVHVEYGRIAAPAAAMSKPVSHRATLQSRSLPSCRRARLPPPRRRGFFRRPSDARESR